MPSEAMQRSPALPRGFLHGGENPAGRFYLLPHGRVHSGCLDFAVCRVLIRDGGRVRRFEATPDAILEWAWGEGEDAGAHAARVLDRLRAPLPAFAGIGDPGRPLVMGIVNVTPDSFSDGGRHADPARAVEHGLALVEEGADILDIGGESTRPAAEPVAEAEEIDRVLPVVEGLRGCGLPLSVDTRRTGVMAAALDAGATIVNDVTALRGDVGALDLVAGRRAPVVLMHMRGEPRTMQRAPAYDDVLLDVYDFLNGAVAACESAGLSRRAIAVDPGFGFGKTPAHNVALIAGLGVFCGLGCPVLLGASRKSTVAALSRGEPAAERLPGSLALAVAALERGARILRVHDVAATRQAVALWQAVSDA
jgi:dihydropteroate synthase